MSAAFPPPGSVEPAVGLVPCCFPRNNSLLAMTMGTGEALGSREVGPLTPWKLHLWTVSGSGSHSTLGTILARCWGGAVNQTEQGIREQTFEGVLGA